MVGHDEKEEKVVEKGQASKRWQLFHRSLL